MASRILGFFLGLLFTFLAVLPFIMPMLIKDVKIIDDAIKIVYYTFALGPVPIPTIILLLIGFFCLQSAIRDTWPFYG